MSVKRKRLFILSALAFIILLSIMVLLTGNAETNFSQAEGIRAAVQKDRTLMKTYKFAAGPINAPTVVLDVTDKTVLDKISGAERKPSNAILEIDGNCNVIDESGGVLGSFTEVYTNVLKPNNVIPVLSVSSQEAVDSVITYLTEQNDILDLAVMSSEPDFVKKIRTADTKIRGIISFEAVREPYDIIKVVNSNYANVAVIPSSYADAKTVRYIHARFKTVWVIPEGTGALDLCDCVNSGAYGIVSPDSDAVYNVLSQYGAKALTRTPFNVAHRGLPKKYHENSLSGVKAAVAQGATHVELDTYITTDRELVVNHDNDISRTTDGSGKIEEMTLAELKTFNLDLIGAPEPLATLDEVMREIKGKDTVLVLEIKSAKTEICEVLKAKIEKFDFWEQIVVITSNYRILGKMKEVLPQIPTADLNPVKTSDFVSALQTMGEYNTGVDISCTVFDRDLNENYFRDRGIVGWYWTFDNANLVKLAADAGLVGLTNNQADGYANNIMLIEGKEAYKTELAAGDSVTVYVTYYSGNTTETEAKVFMLEDSGDTRNVIAVLDNYYTQSFKIHIGTEPVVKEETIKKKGCGNRAECGIPLAALFLFAVDYYALIKRKKRRNV